MVTVTKAGLTTTFCSMNTETAIQAVGNLHDFLKQWRDGTVSYLLLEYKVCLFPPVCPGLSRYDSHFASHLFSLRISSRNAITSTRRASIDVVPGNSASGLSASRPIKKVARVAVT